MSSIGWEKDGLRVILPPELFNVKNKEQFVRCLVLQLTSHRLSLDLGARELFNYGVEEGVS